MAAAPTNAVKGQKDVYGWGEVWHNNTCIIKSEAIYWFNGVSPETLKELTPVLDHNTIYTPHGKEGTKVNMSYGTKLHSEFVVCCVDMVLMHRRRRKRMGTPCSILFPPASALRR